MGMIRGYPRVVAFAGPEYFGLDLNDYAASQGTAQMEMYVGHIRRGDRTGDLMLIEKDYVELLLGLGHCPLENPERAEVDYVENSWILALAKFLKRCGGSILTEISNCLVG